MLVSTKASDGYYEQSTNYIVAIWDNRTVYHTAIFDFAGLGARTGHRAVGIGERPYFDPKSKTRREALAGE
jgi:hypothetical protein